MKSRKLPSSFPADALLLASGDAAFGTNANFRYWSGLGTDNAYFILPRSGEPSLLVSEMNAPHVKSMTQHQVISYERGKSLKTLASFLKPFRSIAISKRDVSASFYENLCKKTHKNFKDATDFLSSVRAIKSDEEIEKIQKACRIARKALSSIEIKPGKTEIELRDEFLHFLLDLHSSPSFPPIFLAGARAAFPHATPGKTRIKQGQLLLCDVGAKFDGFCSDMTRVFFVGKAKPEEGKLYDKVREVAEACANFVRPNMPATSVMRFCSEQFKEKGLPLMPHGLGHGIGLDVHELPSLRLDSKCILRKNMVFTIEPGYYVPGKVGFRYENTFLLKRRAKRL